MHASAVCVLHIVRLRAMNAGVKRRTQVLYPGTMTEVHKSRLPGLRSDYILWRLVFVGLQYVTCFVLSIERLGFRTGF